MICKYCGNVFNGNFCTACGAKAEDVPNNINGDNINYQPPMQNPMQNPMQQPMQQPMQNPMQPPTPPEKKKSKGPIVALIVILCVALIVAGVFGYLYFSGKDKKDSDDDKTEKETVSASEDYDDEESDDEDYYDSEDEDEAETEYDSQNESGTVNRGQLVSDNTYENSALGIRITCPDDWTFYNDEELASLSDNVQDFTSVQTAPTIMFTSDSSASTINIVASKTTLDSIPDEHFDELMEEVKKQYSSLGIGIDNVTRSDKNIDGIDFCGVKYSMSANGQTIEMSQLFKIVNKVQYVITFTGAPMQDLDYMFDFVHALS